MAEDDGRHGAEETSGVQLPPGNATSAAYTTLGRRDPVEKGETAHVGWLGLGAPMSGGVAGGCLTASSSQSGVRSTSSSRT